MKRKIITVIVFVVLSLFLLYKKIQASHLVTKTVAWIFFNPFEYMDWLNALWYFLAITISFWTISWAIRQLRSSKQHK